MVVLKRKKLLAIGIAVVLVGSYFGYRAFRPAQSALSYVTAEAGLGTLTVSVSGTGQVSSSNQVEVKAEASGRVLGVSVQNGQKVTAGATIVQLDASEALKAVRDAEVNLESARLSLEKLKKPAEQLSVIQAENSLARAEQGQASAVADLSKAYEDGFNVVADAFLDLPAVMAGLQSVLYSYTPGLSSSGQWNIDFYATTAGKYDERAVAFKDDAALKYQDARKRYDQNFQNYKSASRLSPTSTIESLIAETYGTSKSVAEAVKSASNLVQFYQDKLTERNLTPAAASDQHVESLSTYTGQVNGHLSSLLNAQSGIQDSKDALVNAGRALQESRASLDKLLAGTDTLDIRAAELTVRQRENALRDAREKLADYAVRAPFDGTVAELTVKRGSSVSSGTAVATLVAAQRIAEVSLNEVDVAKVAVGQKVALSFDAIEDLNLTGQVAEVDTLGTASQGVVTYAVKVAFDVQDDRIKPGMSVSATVITDVKTGVLLVPSAAVKNQGSDTYVEVLENGTPRRQPVEVGSSNDTMTEVTGGLSEGVAVITQTVDRTKQQSTTSGQQRGGSVIPGLGNPQVRVIRGGG